MKYAVTAARTLVGLVFVVFGLNMYLEFIPKPPQTEVPEAARQFGAGLFTTPYIHAVKVLEIAGGAMLLAGVFPLLGLAIILPIALNILFYDLFLMGQPALGVPLVALCVFVLVGYRKTLAPVFAPRPPVG